MSHARRYLTALAGLGCALLAFASTAPAALATLPPPEPGQPGVVSQPATQIIVTGGMPGWQIALIALGAALVAAVTAVMLNRVWTARRLAHSDT